MLPAFSLILKSENSRLVNHRASQVETWFGVLEEIGLKLQALDVSRLR
jgi:hypothetical protein